MPFINPYAVRWGCFWVFVCCFVPVLRLIDCAMVFWQVLEGLLMLNNELAVQIDAHDTLWGETGTFSSSSSCFSLSFLSLCHYFCAIRSQNYSRWDACSGLWVSVDVLSENTLSKKKHFFGYGTELLNLDIFSLLRYYIGLKEPCFFNVKNFLPVVQ